MIHIEHEFEVAEPVERVWALVSDFDAFARCVPTLVEYRMVGPDRATGVVGVTLGAIPIRSRVDVEVTERRHMACIKGCAVSYLGETVAEQLRAGRPGQIASDEVGRIDIHLDLRPAESGGTRLVFISDVEAQGKLARIYQSIMKLKAEGLKRDFERKVREALRAAAPAVAGAASVDALAPTLAAMAPVAVPPPSGRLFDRLRVFFRRLWAFVTGAREGAA